MPVWIGDDVQTPFSVDVEVVSGMLLMGLLELELDTQPGKPGGKPPS